MRYLQRSLKYFLTLCIAYAAMLYVFSLATNEVLTPGQNFHAIMTTQRGVFLVVALIVLSAFYPYFGYVKRLTKGDIVFNREQIIEAMRRQNMKLHHESNGRMTFIADSFFKRVVMLFEDHIKVIQHPDNQIEVTGNRKAVAYIMYRLESAIELAGSGSEDAEA